MRQAGDLESVTKPDSSGKISQAQGTVFCLAEVDCSGSGAPSCVVFQAVPPLQECLVAL